MIPHVILLLFWLIILVVSAQFAVKALTKMSKAYGISAFSAAFVVMALCTSLPELFVGINSALQGTPALSLGNVIGSNIVNLTLIAGIGIVLARGYNVKTKDVKKEVVVLLFAYLVPLLLMWLGNGLSRMDGFLLILGFIWYVWNAYHNHSKRVLDERVTTQERMLSPLLFLFTLVLLIISANFVVKEALLLTQHIAPLLIGVVLLALGTSLPELTFTISAFLKHHGELSLGDLIGAGIVNATLVLGVTSLIHPITADLLLFRVSGLFMAITGILFVFFAKTREQLSMREGIVLLLVYAVFITVEVYLPLL